MKIAGVLLSGRRRFIDQLVMVVVVAVGIVLTAACSRPASAPALPSLSQLQVTPDAILHQLSPAQSVEVAAGQLATLLDAPSDMVRVRIQPRDCQICSVTEAQATVSPEGISVAEAAAQLESADVVWLVVQELACMYYFDGASWLPKNCQLSPM